MRRTPATTPPAIVPTLVDEDLDEEGWGEEEETLFVPFVMSGLPEDQCMRTLAAQSEYNFCRT